MTSLDGQALRFLEASGGKVWRHPEGGWSAEKDRFGYWGCTPHELLRRVLKVKDS